MKEQELVNFIIHYINAKGHTVWRNNAGRIPVESKGKRRMINVGQKGLPDVLGYTKDGRFIGIEAKVKPNKPTMLQQLAIDRMKDAGCIAAVVYSPEEIQEIL